MYFQFPLAIRLYLQARRLQVLHIVGCSRAEEFNGTKIILIGRSIRNLLMRTMQSTQREQTIGHPYTSARDNVRLSDNFRSIYDYFPPSPPIFCLHEGTKIHNPWRYIHTLSCVCSTCIIHVYIRGSIQMFCKDTALTVALACCLR